MKKIFLFLLLFLILITKTSTFDVPDELKNVCPDGCKRYFNCDKEKQKCVFKGFFPIYPLELFEILIIMAGGSLATSCGVGGGLINTPVIMAIEGLEPSEAMPVSVFIILTCGFVTFISFSMDKLKNPQNKFISYDVVVIFGPSMLAGAKVGTILNKILSSLLLLIFLCFLVCFSGYKTYKNILKAKEREAKLSLNNDKKDKNEKNHKNENNDEKNDNDFIEKTGSIIKIEDIDSNKENKIDQDGVDFSKLNVYSKFSDDINYDRNKNFVLTEEDEKILVEDKNPFNWKSINFILLMEAIVIIDTLIEGSNRVPSLFGIKRCSIFYWLTFILYFIITIYFINYSTKNVNMHMKRKKFLIPDYNSEVLEIIANNPYYIVFWGFIAGIVSSSLGVGGGMVTNPVFAGLGLTPKECSTTSNFLIVVTSLASSFIYITSGQLDFVLAVCLAIFATSAAYIGSRILLNYINRTGRSSILFIIMEYFLGIALIISIYKIYAFDTKDNGYFKSLFITNKFC